jgi:hypothetical protein
MQPRTALLSTLAAQGAQALQGLHQPPRRPARLARFGGDVTGLGRH